MKKVIFLLSLCMLPFCLNIPQVPITLQFHSSVETLNKIADMIMKKEKGVYLRFGDGDILLAYGLKDSYQEGDPSLQRELNEAFALNGPNILKCLPLHCESNPSLQQDLNEAFALHGANSVQHALLLGGKLGQVDEDGMVANDEFLGPFEISTVWLDLVRSKWNGEIHDVYSPVALAYTATDHLDDCLKFLKFLKQSKCFLLIGNADIPPSLRELLFGSECQFIPTPSRDAYREIDRIERECLEKIQQAEGYKIIVTLMGCSGRALQKRLWKKLDNVFLFDFGSLIDAICARKTRPWITLTRFDSEQFLKILEQELNDL